MSTTKYLVQHSPRDGQWDTIVTKPNVKEAAVALTRYGIEHPDQILRIHKLITDWE